MPPPAKRWRFFSLPWPRARGCGKRCAGCRRPGRSIPFPWTRRPTTSSRAVCRSSPRLLPRRRKGESTSPRPLVPSRQGALLRHSEEIRPRGPCVPLLPSRPHPPRPHASLPGPNLSIGRSAGGERKPGQSRGPRQRPHHGHPRGWIGSGRLTPGRVLRGRKPPRVGDRPSGGARMAPHGPVAKLGPRRARVPRALQGAASRGPMRGPMRGLGLVVGRPTPDGGKDRGI